MQGPNRMGLGMRPAYGQGPPIGSLPPSGAMGYGQMGRPMPGMLVPGQAPPGAAAVGGTDKLTTVFVGSISAGVSNEFLTSLFAACGPIKSFTRNTAANGKLQGFGFIEFEEPDAVARALKLLNGKTILAHEPDQPNKPLVVRADDKVKAHLQAYENSRIRTDQDETADLTAETLISSIIDQSNQTAVAAGNSATSAQAAVPMHLRDLTEADLPENQRGLVISEIALFRERASVKKADPPVGGYGSQPPATPSRSAGVGGFSGAGAMANVPSGPKERVWGRNARRDSASNSHSGSGANADTHGDGKRGFGNTPQGYNQSPNFVKGDAGAPEAGETEKSDEELERERVAIRKREEDESFRDRERRWESREHSRIANIERIIARERLADANQDKDGTEMRERLHVWDDDESDELFYTDRPRWRATRARFLKSERAADERSRAIEERQAEHLRQESEAFLSKQMEEMQSLAEEQRKAGLLMDDGAPVKLSIGGAASTDPSKSSGAAGATKKPGVSLTSGAGAGAGKAPVAGVFGADDDDDDDGGMGKRKQTLVKIDFGGFEADSRRDRLEKLRASIKSDQDSLFKAKIRWDGISDQLIDRKLEKLVRSLMIKYLGELDDDDMVMFVVEHLKDHKSPQKIVEGLEPVLLEEAAEFTISLWRQVVFESLAYGEGFETEDMLVD
ncbi:hypothetical protein DL93DRAFT_2090566 [Clavulina sp. PMI_390]|nr:hypothetical protein DL93DRAFT_2090566 [Clavulina sp. PMI_390]